jgi:hypothetical protein
MAKRKRWDDMDAGEKLIEAFHRGEAPERAARKAMRRQGGDGYRDVEDHGKDGLFVGNIKIEHDAVDLETELMRPPRQRFQNGRLPHSVAKALDLPMVGYDYRLHDCACGRKFIAHYSFKLCQACRQGRQDALRSKLDAFTADRAANRAETRQTICAHCGQPMTTQRSTKRYCSDACRNAERAR